MLDPSDIPVESDTSAELKKPTEVSVVLDNDKYQLPAERNFLGRLRHQVQMTCIFYEFIHLATCHLLLFSLLVLL